MRLLLVEDDALLAQGVAGALDRMGYRVEQCENGQQAMLALEQGPFDCVVLDLGLPDGLLYPS